MSGVFKYSGVRKSHQSLNEIYFWTSVIKDWKHLLKSDESDSYRMKMIVIGSFQWLVQHELVHIYGYSPDSYQDAQSYTCTVGTVKDERQRNS
jgi:hypothetical protein